MQSTSIGKEVLEVDKAKNKEQLTTFNTGLKSKDFVVILAKESPSNDGGIAVKSLEVYERKRCFSCNQSKRYSEG